MEQVSINVIPEEAIAYNYKEVGINNLAEFRCAKVQLGFKCAIMVCINVYMTYICRESHILHV